MEAERPLTVGQYLREERERRNISLESISRTTRITMGNLQALEGDEFLVFSAPIFVRGFLRTYAMAVGLDAQKVVSMYEAQADLLDSAKKIKKEIPAQKPRPLMRYVLPLVLIVLAAGIMIFSFLKKPALTPRPPAPPAASLAPKAAETTPAKVLMAHEETTPQNPEPAKASAVPEKLTAESLQKIEGGEQKANKVPEKPAAGSIGTAGEESKRERRHVLKIMARESSWVRIQIDDQPPLDALLQPQETATWTARRGFNITLGNAGGVELSFNGIAQGHLGKSGQVVHLLLPPEGKSSQGAEKKESAVQPR